MSVRIPARALSLFLSGFAAPSRQVVLTPKVPVGRRFSAPRVRFFFCLAGQKMRCDGAAPAQMLFVALSHKVTDASLYLLFSRYVVYKSTSKKLKVALYGEAFVLVSLMTSI